MVSSVIDLVIFSYYNNYCDSVSNQFICVTAP
jgi:hypothetical protein